MKRIKHVVSTNMVAHLWAHKTQADARNAHRNLYFEGDTIYSYGSHFPIATHYQGVVLLTTATYSKTTASHIHCVRAACRHLPTFTVPSLSGEHKVNLQHYRNIFVEQLAQAKKSRIYVRQLVNRAEAIRLEANKYAEHFGLKTRVDAVPDEYYTLAHVSDRKKDVHDNAVETRRTAKFAKWREEAAERERVSKLTAEEKIAVWLSGQYIYLPYDLPVYLRAKDGNCETTKGARCPLEHAHLAYLQVLRCVRSNVDWHRNGERIQVGDFQIDSISATGNVVAGCHNIHYSEIIRFAATQGW